MIRVATLLLLRLQATDGCQKLRRALRRIIGGAGLTLVITSIALADPCTAPVNHFRPGDRFVGQVRYVGDGDSICIGRSPNPRTWVEVRLADFYAPELHAPGGEWAKATMMRLARGRMAMCTAQIGDHGRVTSYDRVIAVCRINGVSLGDQMRRASVREGGNGW
jgi:endonuclease YncB( thermonuclease family)